MKKILFVMTLLVSSAVFAQEVFSELDGFNATERKTNDTLTTQLSSANQQDDDYIPTLTGAEIIEDDDFEDEGEGIMVDMEEGNMVSEQDLFAPKKQEERPDITSPVASTPETEEDEEDENAQKIIIYLASAESTTPPNQNMAYCFGDLKFASTLKRPVKALDVTLTYGGYTSTYKIRNLVKNVEQSESFGLVGDACNLIMDMPKMNITQCVVEDMSEANCKKKVSFLPLNE